MTLYVFKIFFSPIPLKWSPFAKIEVLAVFCNEKVSGVELFLGHNKVGRSGSMLAGKNPNMNVSSAGG